MMRILLPILAALAATPISAQLTGLVTTADGAELYSASSLPLKASDQPEQARIYRIGSEPLTVVASVEKVGPANPCIGTLCFSNFYELSHPDIGRDGAVLTYGEG